MEHVYPALSLSRSTTKAFTIWPRSGQGAATTAQSCTSGCSSSTDSTSALQSPGLVGVSVYVSSSATNGPVNVGFDDLHAEAP